MTNTGTPSAVPGLEHRDEIRLGAIRVLIAGHSGLDHSSAQFLLKQVDRLSQLLNSTSQDLFDLVGENGKLRGQLDRVIAECEACEERLAEEQE